jgi:hypothetical protein
MANSVNNTVTPAAKRVECVSVEITGLKDCFAIALLSPWISVYPGSAECAHNVYVNAHRADTDVYVNAKDGNLTGNELSRTIFERASSSRSIKGRGIPMENYRILMSIGFWQVAE